MEDKTLLKISLVMGILGVLLLFFLSSEIELDAVEKVDMVEEGEVVKVKGVVGKVSDSEKVAFLEVFNEKIEKVKVVLFKDGMVDVSEGDYVEISGTVEDYLGEKEVIGSKVVKK